METLETVHTQCRICMAACGLEVTVDRDENRVVRIEPDRENPFTWRDFCRKGKTAAEVAEHPRRITSPMRRVGDRYEPATYAEAIADIARRLNTIIDRDGPNAVGSYHGNPMGFSFTTSVFWTGLLDAIGTANRFYVASVDQNAAHLVLKELYGNELLGLPADIDHCRCFLLVGTDPAVSRFNWVDNQPDGWNRVRAAQKDGADLIVVDPRRSKTAKHADTHLAVRPGQDWALLLAMVRVILDEGLERPSASLPISGIDVVRAVAAEADLIDLADRCGLELEAIQDVARRFARAPSAMCLTNTGVAMHQHGALGVWLGHVLNLLTDRIDVPGGRRYESGLVDMSKLLPMFFPDTGHRSRLRGNAPIVGCHALAELPDEILTPGRDQIRAMLVAFGNPVISGPDGQAPDAAFEDLELLVAVDVVQRESHRHAHWLLPGTHWLERSEVHPLMSGLQEKPYAMYGPAAIDRPEGVLEEWELFTELALAMGRNLFGRPGVNRVIRATRRLAERTGRDIAAFDPEWVQRGAVAFGRRVKWRDLRGNRHGMLFREPQYGELADALMTPDKTVNIAPPRFVFELRRTMRAPHLGSDYPLIMLGRRHRESMNSWLNESPGLFRLERDNPLEVHPSDASRFEVEDGERVRLVSDTGAIEIAVRVTEDVAPGTVCVAHGWGSRVFDPASAAEPLVSGVNRNVLVDARRVDPLAQTPAFNSTPVRLERLVTSSR